jgi:spore maturation protein A
MVVSILVAASTGKISNITSEAITSAGPAAMLIIKLIGILTLWLGIAKIAERSGLLKIFTRLLQPIVGCLFPSIPKGHPAMGAILMNFSANLIGLGSAATPFGLKAMEELQKLNRSDRASEAMCTFLAINTSSITLIPSTIIAIRINAGSVNPTEIVGTMLFATSISTFVAICADYICRVNARKRGRI